MTPDDDIKQKVQEALLLLENYWETSQDLLFVFESGYAVKVSPSIQKILGYTIQDLHDVEWIPNLVHPNDMPRTNVAHDLVRTKKIQARPFRNRIRTKDGGYVWLVWHSSPEIEGRIYAVAWYVSVA